MKVTKVEEQALRLAIALARHDGIATLSALSEEEGLSEALVAKILGRMRRGGVVVAIRGRNGGYTLAASPESLSVTDVLGALGGPLLQGCFNEQRGDGVEPCPHSENCGVRPVWRHLESQLSRVFEGITLAHLLRTEQQVQDRVERLWSAPVNEAPAEEPQQHPITRKGERIAAQRPRTRAAAVPPENKDGRKEPVTHPGRAVAKEWMRDES